MVGDTRERVVTSVEAYMHMRRVVDMKFSVSITRPSADTIETPKHVPILLVLMIICTVLITPIESFRKMLKVNVQKSPYQKIKMN